MSRFALFGVALLPLAQAGLAQAVSTPVPISDQGRPSAGPAIPDARTGIDTAATASSPGPAQLEEITVTAQKRSEDLQNVPIAVTAVKALALEAAGIVNVIDLRIAVPTLNSTNTNGYLTSSIRGIGSIGVGVGVEYPIAVYIDGVYIASPIASALSLNNIEGIEVLKGPQGTLFGRNATGGLIQITTRTPGNETRGKFELGYANYQTISGSAYLSGPLTDNLFADIAITGRGQGEGWGVNINTGEDVYRVNHEIAVRSKLVWKAAEGTKFTLIGDYIDVRESRNSLNFIPGTRQGAPFVSGQPALDYGYDSNSTFSPVFKTWAAGGSLRLDQDIGDLQLSNIAAYRQSRNFLDQDIDLVPADVQSFQIIQTDRQISNELQLSSRSASRLKWTLGAYYYNAKSAYAPVVINATGLGARITVNNTQRTESEAVYGQATYEIIDDTNLTLGGRYTHEKRQEVDTTSDVFVLPIALQLPTVNFPRRQVSFNKFTYRASIDHRFSDEVLAYASVNRGFKSGGFNSNTPGVAPYLPETLDAYEVGLKTDLLGRRLRVNIAGFYYDYTDVQVQKVGPDGTTISIINGPSARIYGVDADLTVVVSDAVSLTSGIGWISPKFGSFTDCPQGVPGGGVQPKPGICSGNQLPLASKFVANVSVNYKAPLGDGELRASGNVYYNSGFYFEPDNLIHQKRFAQLGTTVKWVAHRGLSVGVFGKNLTNRRVIAYGATNGDDGDEIAMYAEPRTYGFTLGYEF